MSKTNRFAFLWPNETADGQVHRLCPTSSELVENVQPTDLKNVGTAIAEHPRASLTMAATFGVVLGWFIKRK